MKYNNIDLLYGCNTKRSNELEQNLIGPESLYVPTSPKNINQQSQSGEK